MKNYDGYDRKDRLWDFCKFVFWVTLDVIAIVWGSKSFKGFFN